tara:strand:+ start:944 stop:2179 length:1236 start_codon:yes stop_codon:yes gene_type:complete
MANRLLTISDITREALAVLHEECQLLKVCTRKYEDRFSKTGAKIGASVDVRKPAKYGVTNTANLTGAVQDSEEAFVTLSVDQRRSIGMNFSSEDLTLKISDFSARFIKPAVARLAREVDLYIAEIILLEGIRQARANLTNDVSFDDVVDMNASLSTQFAAGDRRLFIDAKNDASIVKANKGLFQSSTQISDQYEKGVMGVAGGFKFVETESVPQITFSGTLTGGLVNGATANGATSIVMDTLAGTATAIKKGQAFTIAGVYQVDPETLTPNADLYTFIAQADETIVSPGTATVPVKAIWAADNAASAKADVNLSTLPANNAAVAFLEGAAIAGSLGKLLAGVSKDAIAFASVDLELPGVSKMEGRESYDGVSMRIVKTYDGLTDEGLYRLDLLFGAQILRPEHVVSVIGKV